MTDLVYLKNDEAVTTSLIVSEKFNKEHSKVIRSIENLLGGLSKSGDTLFKKSHYIEKQNGQSYPMYYMNRDGFALLVMGFTGKKALQWKLDYIAAFNAMESVIREKSTTIWIETRQRGMLTRSAETDAIKDFIQYALAQGSTHADKYYILFSNLADKLSGIQPKCRNHATTHQLNNLAIFENIILEVIKAGIKANLPYKEIYQNCKARCEQAKEIALLT